MTKKKKKEEEKEEEEKERIIRILLIIFCHTFYEARPEPRLNLCTYVAVGGI